MKNPLDNTATGRQMMWEERLKQGNVDAKEIQKKWKEMLGPNNYHGWDHAPNYVPFKEYKWRDSGANTKKKPDPKLVVVDLTIDQVRALLEDPDEGVQVTLDGYIVLIRER